MNSHNKAVSAQETWFKGGNAEEICDFTGSKQYRAH